MVFSLLISVLLLLSLAAPEALAQANQKTATIEELEFEETPGTLGQRLAAQLRAEGPPAASLPAQLQAWLAEVLPLISERITAMPHLVKLGALALASAWTLLFLVWIWRSSMSGPTEEELLERRLAEQRALRDAPEVGTTDTLAQTIRADWPRRQGTKPVTGHANALKSLRDRRMGRLEVTEDATVPSPSDEAREGAVAAVSPAVAMSEASSEAGQPTPQNETSSQPVTPNSVTENTEPAPVRQSRVLTLRSREELLRARAERQRALAGAASGTFAEPNQGDKPQVPLFSSMPPAVPHAAVATMTNATAPVDKMSQATEGIAALDLLEQLARQARTQEDRPPVEWLRAGRRSAPEAAVEDGPVSPFDVVTTPSGGEVRQIIERLRAKRARLQSGVGEDKGG